MASVTTSSSVTELISQRPDSNQRPLNSRSFLPLPTSHWANCYWHFACVVPIRTVLMHRSLMLFTRRGHELEMSPFWSSVVWSHRSGCLEPGNCPTVRIGRSQWGAQQGGVFPSDKSPDTSALTGVLISHWKNLEKPAPIFSIRFS